MLLSQVLWLLATSVPVHWATGSVCVTPSMPLLQVEEAKKQRDGQPWPAEDREALREKIRQRSGALHMQLQGTPHSPDGYVAS